MQTNACITTPRNQINPLRQKCRWREFDCGSNPNSTPHRKSQTQLMDFGKEGGIIWSNASSDLKLFSITREVLSSTVVHASLQSSKARALSLKPSALQSPQMHDWECPAQTWSTITDKSIGLTRHECADVPSPYCTRSMAEQVATTFSIYHYTILYGFYIDGSKTTIEEKWSLLIGGAIASLSPTQFWGPTFAAVLR